MNFQSGSKQNQQNKNVMAKSTFKMDISIKKAFDMSFEFRQAHLNCKFVTCSSLFDTKTPTVSSE